MNHGRHLPLSSPHGVLNHGSALLQVIAQLAGDGPTDRPSRGSPVLWQWMIAWGDALPDDARQQLRRYVWPLSNSVADIATECERQWDVIDWAVRTLAPTWLRAAGLRFEADRIADLPTVTNAHSLTIVEPPADLAVRTTGDVLRHLWAALHARAPGHPSGLGAPAADPMRGAATESRVDHPTMFALVEATTAALGAGRTLTNVADRASGYFAPAEPPAAWRKVLAATNLAAEIVGWRAVLEMTRPAEWSWRTSPPPTRQMAHSVVSASLRTIEQAVNESAHQLVERMLQRGARIAPTG